jgi:hypothetical protein
MAQVHRISGLPALSNAATSTEEDSVPTAREVNNFGSVREKKNAESVARRVDVAFKINHISDIESIDSTFTISIKIFYHWEDPKLVGHKKCVLSESEVEENGYFDPDIIITNDFEMCVVSKEFKVIDSKTGAVKVSVLTKGKCFIQNMDLSHFPFDAQNLQLILRPRRLDINSVELCFDASESAMDSHPLHEFRVYGYTAKSYRTDPKASSVGKVYSSLHIITMVQRQSEWYINNVFLASFVLTVLSWASYSLPPEDSLVRMSITILALVCSIEHKYVVGDELPKLPYRTILDIYVDVNFGTQIYATLVNVLVYHYQTAEYGAPWAQSHLNDLLFFIQLGIFVLFHCWYLVTLRDYFSDVIYWRSQLKKEVDGRAKDKLTWFGFRLKSTKRAEKRREFPKFVKRKSSPQPQPIDCRIEKLGEVTKYCRLETTG